MKHAKISEGLIGKEGAIYPCPEGQGIIAKKWGRNDKSYYEYLKVFAILVDDSDEGFILSDN